MRVLVIPDLQVPFEHPDALAFVKAVANKYKPGVVVNVGDEIDHHALGDWDHDPDGLGAGDELKLAIKKLQAWYKSFPKMKVCESNHTSRIFRRAYKHGIPRAYLRDYREFLQAPKGWQWADKWDIDGIRYEHGDAISGGGKMASFQLPLKNMKSTVFGHFHSWAGIQYWANSEYLLYGFNVGCLIDRHAYAFNYGKLLKDKPILGVGLINKGVPTFIPMQLNRKGRWIGKL